MDEQQVYIFNQYYIDFLKKIKALAKEQKEKVPQARSIIKSIRKNYSTMDKLTNDYTNMLDSSDFWKLYEKQETPISFNEEFMNEKIYSDITIGDVLSISKDKYLVFYYVCLLDIFNTSELPIAEVLEVIKVINIPEEFDVKIKDVSNESVGRKLQSLRDMHIQKSKGIFENELKGIEDTSLGKLAKEIMNDIDIDSLKASIDDPNMNIFESLQNPNSGFGKVLGNVSKTMLSKLSSGELQKDTLLKDAIDLATKLPNMLPGGMGGQLGNIGEMLKNLQKMSGGEGGNGTGMGRGDDDKEPDMGEMMSSMMNMMNLNNTQQKRASSHLKREERKNKTANHLKRKLQKRRENNNMQKDVEKAHE